MAYRCSLANSMSTMALSMRLRTGSAWAWQASAKVHSEVAAASAAKLSSAAAYNVGGAMLSLAALKSACMRECISSAFGHGWGRPSCHSIKWCFSNSS